MYTSPAGKTWLLIAIAVIVIAAILVYAFLFRSSKPAALGNVAYAPAGETAPGFPSELILGPSPTTEESYDISYAAGVKQSTAVFTVPRPILSLSLYYQGWFQSNGWTLTNAPSPSSASASVQGISAMKGGDTATVTIVAQTATSSKVTVSYVSQ